MFVQFGGAEGGHALGAFHFGGDDAGIAQDFEVMGAGGLGDIHRDFVASQGAAFCLQQFLDDGQAPRIGERLHDGGQPDVSHRRMGIGLHYEATSHG